MSGRGTPLLALLAGVVLLAGCSRGVDDKQAAGRAAPATDVTPATDGADRANPADRQTPDSPDSPAPPAAKPQFGSFVIKDFNWELMGHDVVVVQADGRAIYVAPVPTTERHKGKKITVPVWHRIDWTVPPERVAALVAEIERIGFRGLDKLYINRDIDDGRSTEYILTDSAGVKKVSCSNKYPDVIRELEKFIYDQIVEKRRDRDQLRAAPALTRDEAEKFWNGY